MITSTHASHASSDNVWDVEPKDIAVTFGDTAHFTCGMSGKKILWIVYLDDKAIGVPAPNILFIDDNPFDLANVEHYYVTQTSTGYDLFIRNVTQWDDQEYECKTPLMKKKVRLTVQST